MKKLQFCPNFNAVMVANAERDMLMARARCGKWDCDYCAEINRRLWRARIYRASEALGGKWAFFTITAHANAKTAQQSLKNLQDGWQRLSQRMRRRYGKFHYVRVYEQHKDGRYHAHLLVNFHFDDVYQQIQRKGTPDERKVWVSRWLKQNAPDCGMGYMTHAENIQHGAAAAAAYVTKYMTKDTGTMAKNVRRIQCSQGFPKLQNEQKYEWRLQSALWLRDLQHVTERGGEVIDITTNHTVTTDDFLDSPFYPPELS